MSHISLDQIEVPDPCPARWEDMDGDDVARFCGHCQKYVHDLSAMTRDAAEQLLCERAGNLCVRFQRCADGHIATLDYQCKDPTQQRRPRWLVACLSVLGIGSAALTAAAVMAPTSGRLTGVVRSRPPLPISPPGSVSPGVPVQASDTDPPVTVEEPQAKNSAGDDDRQRAP